MERRSNEIPPTVARAERMNETPPAGAQGARANEPPLTGAEALRSNFPPEPKFIYSARDRWLLLGAVLLGIVFRVGWDAEGVWMYGAFWAAYAALFLLWQWERAKRNVLAWAVLVPTLALMVLLPYQAKLDDLGGMIFLLFAAIPCALMLHAVLVLHEIPVGREGMVFFGIVRGFFVLPFSSVGRFFGAIRSLWSGVAAPTDESKRRTRQALLGLLFGIPLFILVIVLLCRADARMEQLFDALRTGWDVDFGSILGTVLLVLVTAMLFYSFLHGSIHRLPALSPMRDMTWSAATLGIVETLPLIAYALFLGLQFSYLFGGTLPAAYTYSEYARAGFRELIAVSLINFVLLALSLRYGERRTVLKVLNALLLLSTALLLASAALRVLLYVGAYGLTTRRLLTLWFMGYLAILMVLTAVRLCRRTLPLMRIAALVWIYWFTLLYVPDWGAIMSAFNAAY